GHPAGVGRQQPADAEPFGEQYLDPGHFRGTPSEMGGILTQVGRRRQPTIGGDRVTVVRRTASPCGQTAGEGTTGHATSDVDRRRPADRGSRGRRLQPAALARRRRGGARGGRWGWSGPSRGGRAGG